MAHTCPVCGSTCHCNGDIDDCCFDFDDDLDGCTCCSEDDYDEDWHDDWPDEEEG